MTTEKTDIYTILIASTLNRLLKQYNIDHGDIDSKVKFQYQDFINAINLLILNWKLRFTTNNVFRDITIDKQVLVESINNSRFKDWFTLEKGYLLVEVDESYESKVAEILSEAIWHCAENMLKHVNELGSDVTASAGTSSEVADEKVSAGTADIEVELAGAAEAEEVPATADVQMEDIEMKDSDEALVTELDAVVENTNIINEIADKMGVELTPTMDTSELKSSSVSVHDDLLPVDSKDVTNDFLKDADDEDDPEKLDLEVKEEKLEEEKIANAEEVENVVKEEQQTDESEAQENDTLELSENEEIEDVKVEVSPVDDSERDENDSRSKDATEEPSDHKDNVDSTPRGTKRKSSALSTQKHKRFQQIAINLINSIQAHRFSSPFLQAVNKRDASDYYEVIHEPKDLKNILKAVKLKLDSPPYELVKQLERDIMLMFANAVMYNKSDDDLVRLTISMKNDVNNIFKMFEEAELDIK